MKDQYYVGGVIPERFVEVDAARLLLIIARFARRSEEPTAHLRCLPLYPFVRYFTPEYYLHKLDFLLRYPRYFIYELTELFRLSLIADQQRDELLTIIRSIEQLQEPELLTQHFRKFWRGAYERLDDVESWWHARQLIYTCFEPRGNARPQKYYFITDRGMAEADRLVAEVAHARWYADRIALLYQYFGGLSAAAIKDLQYSHVVYRQAQIDEFIPDLAPEEIEEHFARVFGEQLALEVGA
jgi:DNA-binding PadR family transcriptional regulator